MQKSYSVYYRLSTGEVGEITRDNLPVSPNQHRSRETNADRAYKAGQILQNVKREHNRLDIGRKCPLFVAARPSTEQTGNAKKDA